MMIFWETSKFSSEFFPTILLNLYVTHALLNDTLIWDFLSASNTWSLNLNVLLNSFNFLLKKPIKVKTIFQRASPLSAVNSSVLLCIHRQNPHWSQSLSSETSLSLDAFKEVWNLCPRKYMAQIKFLQQLDSGLQPRDWQDIQQGGSIKDIWSGKLKKTRVDMEQNWWHTRKPGCHSGDSKAEQRWPWT